MDKKKFYTSRVNIVLLATLCCALWGSAYPAIKVSYELFNIASGDVPTKLILAGYRFAMAGIIVLVFQSLGKNNIFKYSLKDFGEFTILGLFSTAIQYSFFYVGLAYASGVSGSIINGTGTFFSIILAHFIYKNDKITGSKALGCIVGFIGVIVVNLRGSSLADGGFALRGEGFIMIAAFILSAASIYGKKISQNKNAATVTGYQLFIGGVILTVAGFVFGGSLTGFTVKSTSILIYMAFLSSVAFVVWSELMKYNKVGTIAMFNFLIPVFGTLLSAIILKENIFDVKILISLVLVCAGIFLVYRVKPENVEVSEVIES